MPISPQSIGGTKRRIDEGPKSDGGEEVSKAYPFIIGPFMNQNRPKKVDISLMYFNFVEKFYKNLIKQYLGIDFCNILELYVVKKGG